MISWLRNIERASRLLWRLRRSLERLEAAFYARTIVPQISRAPAPVYPGIDVDVICLVGAVGADMAMWAARSLDYASQRNWRHVWIDDGTLTSAIICRATRALPGLRVVRPAESDALLSRSLRGYTACRRAAEDHPIFRRVFLLSEVMRGDRCISVDSDVLFFSRPREILEWAAAPVATARFMRDPITFYFPNLAKLSQWHGKPVTPQVNGGLVLQPAGGLDLDLTERLLTNFWDTPGRSWHIEQSILALQMTRLGGRALSDEYEVGFHPERRPYCVARHYVSAGPVRSYFYTEGVALLSRFLLAPNTPQVAHGSSSREAVWQIS